MTPEPETPRASRNRRRGDFVGLLPKLAGAAAVVVAIAFFINRGIHHLERSPPIQPEYTQPKAAAATPAALAEKAPPVQGIQDLEAKRSRIEKMLKSFFQTVALDEKAGLVRDAERVKPLMQAYYARNPLRARMVQGLGTLQSVGERGHRLGYIQVLFSGGNPQSIIIEEISDGEFRADWESLVRYGDMSWEDFLKEKPRQPVLMRVIGSRSTAPPAEGRAWLEIFSPGHDKAVKAFYDPEDPGLRPLLDQLEVGSGKNVPLTLRLCYSELKLNAVSVCIAGVEGKGWLILN